ncbi:MAG: META domain-containing protein [Fibrobacteres bacterium]|nr:META domain-containing protein [Fibrobacterota bacterium]
MKYLVLLILFTTISCNKLSGREWVFLGAKDLQRVQFHTDSMQIALSKLDSAENNVRAKLGMKVKSETTFVKSDPVDLSKIKINLAFGLNKICIEDGCNKITGRYRISGDSLRFDSLLSTLVYCPAEDLFEHKGTVLSYLHSAYKFNLQKSDTLILYSSYDNALIFKKVR